jgi:transcriptional regulator with XRE-family HTH domain
MTIEMEEIAARLRSIRLSRNLTLADVESKSHKKLRAVSLGSYERGDRTLSVKKASELSHFYEVPLSYLLTGHSPTQARSHKIVMDLRRVRELSELSTNQSLTQKILFSFLFGIIKERQDFNGEILSLRKSDIDFLTTTIGCSEDAFQIYLSQHNLLFETKGTNSL